MSFEPSDKYTDSALRVGDTDTYPQRLVGEFIGTVVSNGWVNDEYIHLILKVHPHALKAYAGQIVPFKLSWFPPYDFAGNYYWKDKVYLAK